MTEIRISRPNMDFFYNFNGNIPNHYYMPLFVQSQQPIGVNNPLIMQFPVIPPPPFPMTIQYQSPSQHEQRQSDENMFPIIINIDENPKTGNEKIGSKWYGYKKGKCAMCKSAADILLRPPKMNEIYKEAYEYQFDQYNLFTTSKFSLFNNFDKNENSASAFLFAKNKRFSTYSNLESFDESSLDFSNLKDFGTLKDVEMQLDMNNNHNQQENEKKPASIIAWKKPIIIDPSTSPCYDKVFPSLEQDSKKTNVSYQTRK